MKVAQIMLPDPPVATPDTPASDALKLMGSLECDRLAVVQDRVDMRMEGLVTRSDLELRLAGPAGGNALVGDAMLRRSIVAVAPEQDLFDLLALVKHDRARWIPVVADGLRLVGVIRWADLAAVMGPQEAREMEEELLGDPLLRPRERRPSRRPVLPG